VDVASEAADPLCPDRTYYVTDGGANENLGLVSALYALRGALAKLAPGEIPPIHIVTIEASETAYDYTPDRGINAVISSAKERLTGGLTQELLNDVERRAGAADGGRRIEVHDLALPMAFRSRGAFGTHWMFPGSVVIANPRMAQPLAWYKHLIPNLLSKDSDTAVLHQREIVDMWVALNDPDRDFCTRTWAKDSGRVAGWICGTGSDTALPRADVHIVEWRRLVDAVRN
jgi:hypothetical protein